MIINCIIQARMGSKRFPGKVMAEVAGKPLIGHLLDNIIPVDVDTVIIAMPEDDLAGPLRKYIAGFPWVHLVAGPEHDVAGRFAIALAKYPCDAFVRVCADSPLIDDRCIDWVASSLRDGQPFYLANGGLPGLQVEGMNTELFLSHIDQMNEEEREHVTLFFKRRLGMAVDTPEDLERIKPLLEGKVGMDEWVNHCLS